MIKLLMIDEMKNMSIEDIISMYRNGYTIEENVDNLNQKIISAQDGVTVSTGSLLLIGIGILAYFYLKK